MPSNCGGTKWLVSEKPGLFAFWCQGIITLFMVRMKANFLFMVLISAKTVQYE
jgi:hypothetical protein